MKRVTGLANYAVVPDFQEDFPEGLDPPATERFSPKFLIHNPVFQHAYYRESFKVLRTNLTFAQADKPLKALGVFSAGPRGRQDPGERQPGHLPGPGRKENPAGGRGFPKILRA